MYKTVIVDDERWIVEGIKAGVRWNTYGFQVVGDAENGQEGLELIEKLRPDFVLTDIKMPLVNGLEMIKQGKEISPHTIFAVLSGHAEFAYAQKALNFGTYGYCLKPFEIEEIESMLAKLAITLKSRERLAHQVDDQQLYEFLYTGDEHLLEEKLIDVGMPISVHTPITPLVILGLSAIPVNFQEMTSHLRFRMNSKRVGFLVNSDDASSFIQSIKLVDTSEKLSIGVGPSAATPAELEASLELASIAAYGCFSTKKGDVYQPSQTSNTTIDTLLKELTNAISQKDSVHFTSLMESSRELFYLHKLTIKDAYLIYNTVMYLFTREGINKHNRFLEGYDRLYYDYGHADAMIDDLIEQTLGYMSDDLSSSLARVTHSRIKEIVTYIHHHFNQEISVQSLSEKFYLSPTYLSQLFKKEVGENFVEYLSRLRIQYACKLLHETDLTISQIGEKCGFNDYFYFTRIFKRIIGKTPTQYRSQHESI